MGGCVTTLRSEVSANPKKSKLLLRQLVHQKLWAKSKIRKLYIFKDNSNVHVQLMTPAEHHGVDRSFSPLHDPMLASNKAATKILWIWYHLIAKSLCAMGGRKPRWFIGQICNYFPSAAPTQNQREAPICRLKSATLCRSSFCKILVGHHPDQRLFSIKKRTYHIWKW